MAKYFAGEVAAEAALEAMRVLGGYRYSPEFPVERLYRDAPIADRRGVDERGAAARHRSAVCSSATASNCLQGFVS